MPTLSLWNRRSVVRAHPTVPFIKLTFVQFETNLGPTERQLRRLKQHPHRRRCMLREHAPRAVDPVGTGVSNAPTETAGTGVTLAEPIEVKRRLAAILAADVEGYSRLMGADE